jgi:phosphatidylglycerophosphate synthase
MVALVTLPPTPLVCAAVVVGLLVAYALDSADGQVARVTGVSSRQGEWLDHVVDAARLPAFHLSVGVALVRGLGLPGWAGGLAVGFALLSSVWFFAQILASQMTAAHATPSTSARQDGASGVPEPRRAPAWVSFAKLPSDIGTLYLLVLVMPWTSWFLVGYSGLLVYSVVMAAAALARRYRELGSLDRGFSSPRPPLP